MRGAKYMRYALALGMIKERLLGVRFGIRVDGSGRGERSCCERTIRDVMLDVAAVAPGDNAA